MQIIKIVCDMQIKTIYYVVLALSDMNLVLEMMILTLVIKFQGVQLCI